MIIGAGTEVSMCTFAEIDGSYPEYRPCRIAGLFLKLSVIFNLPFRTPQG
jgi:hypothetical protein